jgi:hypothetical protein
LSLGHQLQLELEVQVFQQAALGFLEELLLLLSSASVGHLNYMSALLTLSLNWVDLIVSFPSSNHTLYCAL